MERLWMSLLMMVASSSAFLRSVLPPNGSSIEADWSRRKMKQPGFLRLISALYMLAPRFRLFRASFDLAGFDLLGRHVDLLLPGRGVDRVLPCGGVDRVGGHRRRHHLLRLDERRGRGGSGLAERPVTEE